MNNIARSPLPWVGGKHYSAERIIQAFPHQESYTTFVDVFGGAGNILFSKPPYNHLEVYNDYCKDLVNFWMHCVDNPTRLQEKIDKLPYARSLYDEWNASLFNGQPLSDLDRAVRWFYVLRSSVGGVIRKSKGNWGYGVQDNNKLMAQYLHSATQLFQPLAKRFRAVQIECQDFEKIIKTYERPTTFFYCDPPYIGAEFYYIGTPPFALEDHERLAQSLNATPAKVALSYYPHEKIDQWYQPNKWRRITWQTYKSVEKTRTTRQTATELLLCNYPAPTQSLWDLPTEGGDAA